MKTLNLLSVLLVVLAAGMAAAQETADTDADHESAETWDVGELEYAENCSACHGSDGKGGTELANLLTVTVPDLTQISARNDGVFPLLDIIQIIDGRTGIRGHGYPMPVWGKRFSEDARGIGSQYVNEVMVRGRVLTLAEYLQSIQE